MSLSTLQLRCRASPLPHFTSALSHLVRGGAEAGRGSCTLLLTTPLHHAQRVSVGLMVIHCLCRAYYAASTLGGLTNADQRQGIQPYVWERFVACLQSLRCPCSCLRDVLCVCTDAASFLAQSRSARTEAKAASVPASDTPCRLP